MKIPKLLLTPHADAAPPPACAVLRTRGPMLLITLRSDGTGHTWPHPVTGIAPGRLSNVSRTSLALAADQLQIPPPDPDTLTPQAPPAIIPLADPDSDAEFALCTLDSPRLYRLATDREGHLRRIHLVAHWGTLPTPYQARREPLAIAEHLITHFGLQPLS